MAVKAQSKKATQVLGNTRLLEKAVFGSKDSLVLEKLFATTVVYGHSNGQVQSREQAIRSIIGNRSTYVPAAGVSGYDVKEVGDSVIVIKGYKAMEIKEDGTESLLNLSIETVWAKENGNWKLFRRQARKAE